MHDGTKIAMAAGALGAVAGLAMQGVGDQMIQTIGQGWMLGGVASTALMGGVAAISAKWQSYRRECEINYRIDKLQQHVDNNHLIHAVQSMTEFTSLAGAATERFEDTSEKKRAAVTLRLHVLGMSLADKMPTPEMSDAAANSVHRSMGSVRFKLGQSLAQDAPVRQAGIDIDISSPSMGS